MIVTPIMHHSPRRPCSFRLKQEEQGQYCKHVSKHVQLLYCRTYIGLKTRERITDSNVRPGIIRQWIQLGPMGLTIKVSFVGFGVNKVVPVETVATTLHITSIVTHINPARWLGYGHGDLGHGLFTGLDQVHKVVKQELEEQTIILNYPLREMVPLDAWESCLVSNLVYTTVTFKNFHT